MRTSPFLCVGRRVALGALWITSLSPQLLHGQDSAKVRRDTTTRAQTRPSVRDTAAKPAAKDTNRADTTRANVPPADTTRGVVVGGRVIGLRGYRGTGILVSLTARTATGDTIWSSATTTVPIGPDSSHGEFAFVYPNSSKLAAAHLDLDVARQKVAVINDTWFRRGKWVRHEHLVIGAAVVDSAGRAAVRRDVALELDPAPPFYTFLLFFPALIGLVAATAALGVFSRRGATQANALEPYGTKKAKNALLGYTAAGTGAWVLVVAYFAIGFVTSGLRKISLFDPDISIPVILPVSAFIGVLVYATECLVGVVRKKDDPDVVAAHTFVDYQQTLIELGNRVFIAPYVAIIAVLTVFRGTADGLAVPFVAFFTGLWIEPVLRALQLVGDKLLPGEKPKDKPTEVEQRSVVKAERDITQTKVVVRSNGDQPPDDSAPKDPPVPRPADLPPIKGATLPTSSIR